MPWPRSCDPPPRHDGRVSWIFPEPDERGLVGVGADLAPATLLDAYRQGVFPWPHAGIDEIPWFSPDPRGVIAGPPHLSRSLRRRIARCGFEITADAAFARVVERCACRPGQGTWITPEMVGAYVELHRLGAAHSVEVWDGTLLVGGIYGVQVGGVFTAESMFHDAPDASKIALAALCRRLAEAGGSTLDVQLVTPHLETLGACEVTRASFLALLAREREREVRLATAPSGASLLLEPW